MSKFGTKFEIIAALIFSLNGKETNNHWAHAAQSCWFQRHHASWSQHQPTCSYYESSSNCTDCTRTTKSCPSNQTSTFHGPHAIHQALICSKSGGSQRESPLLHIICLRTVYPGVMISEERGVIMTLVAHQPVARRISHRKLPVGVGLSICGGVSLALWTMIAFGLRAQFA